MKYNATVNINVDDTEIMDYIGNNYNPEHIFTEQELSTWAEENGFVKKEE